MDNKRKENRKFGLVLSAALLIISLYLFFRKDIKSPVFFGIGILLLLVAILFPAKLIPVKRVWEKFGHFLGRINTVVILTLIYYLVLLPIGCIIKLFGKDILKLKAVPGAKTYWKERFPEEKIIFTQQF